MCWSTEDGQATVEAAFLIPVLFVAMLMLVQPGIILYDRVVMQQAAAEGCRLLATGCTDGGIGEERQIELIKRHLGSVPSQELFHVHNPACSWDVQLEGDEHAREVSVTIRNKVKLLPLFDAAAAWAGAADAEGYVLIEVEHHAQTQPAWVPAAGGSFDVGSWVQSG